MITSPPIPGEVGVRWRTARVGGADDARALASAIQIGTLVDRSPRTWCARGGGGAEMPSRHCPPSGRVQAPLTVRRRNCRFGLGVGPRRALGVRTPGASLPSGEIRSVLWDCLGNGPGVEGVRHSELRARIYPAHDSALDRPAPMGLASLPPAGTLYAGRVSGGRSRCRICPCAKLLRSTETSEPRLAKTATRLDLPFRPYTPGARSHTRRHSRYISRRVGNP